MPPYSLGSCEPKQGIRRFPMSYIYTYNKSIVHQLALARHESIPSRDRLLSMALYSLGGIIII